MSMICMTYPSTHLHLRWRGRKTMSQIGPYVTNSSLRMILALQLVTYFKHPYRMNWTTNIRVIYPCPTENGVKFSPPVETKDNINWAAYQIKRPVSSESEPANYDSNTSAKVRVRTIQGLVSYRTTRVRVRRHPRIKFSSINVFCTRGLECLSASMNRIAQIIAFEKGLTRNLSRKA